MYFQDKRGQGGSWSESDGSVHDHPRRLLFHLNVFLYFCLSVSLYFCISVSLSLYLYLHTILLCRQSHPHSFTLVIISIITNSSAVSKSAVFYVKIHIQLKGNSLDIGPENFLFTWFSNLIRILMARGYFDLINSFEAALGLFLPSFLLNCFS